jgi:hypothetical protein
MRYSLAMSVLMLPHFAAAADIDVASRIDHVTVFPDGAAVTRTARAEVPIGSTTLILRGLPASLDPSSIRVEASGNAEFAIGSVDVRTVPGEANPVSDVGLDHRIRAVTNATLSWAALPHWRRRRRPSSALRK